MNRQLKITVGLLPILVMCFTIIYWDTRLERCFGLVQAMRDMAIIIPLIGYLLVFLTIQLVRAISQEAHQLFRVVSMICAILFTATALLGKFYWPDVIEGQSLLRASIPADELDIGRLRLIDADNYVALYGHVDWSCSVLGSYEIRNDSLFLNDDPAAASNQLFANAYVVQDSFLIPVLEEKGSRTMTLKVHEGMMPSR